MYNMLVNVKQEVVISLYLRLNRELVLNMKVVHSTKGHY